MAQLVELLLPKLEISEVLISFICVYLFLRTIFSQLCHLGKTLKRKRGKGNFTFYNETHEHEINDDSASYNITILTVHLTVLTMHLTILTVHLTVLTMHLTVLTMHLTILTVHLTVLTAHLTILTAYLTVLTVHLTVMTLHLTILRVR